MSVCHGKRNSYSTDFKLKVLEFYLKNGGESVFGLKSRTAEHFNIGKKTVVRIVENKDALLRAKNSKSKKTVDGVTKSASTSKVTTAAKKVHGAGGSSKGSITAVKPVPSHSSKTLVLSLKANKVGSKNVASVAAKKEVKKEAAPVENAVKSPAAAPRLSEDRKRSAELRGEHEEVLDLPEDPDYAILKMPIDGGTTATGVAGPALLLSTATDEVRRALVYECEVLYECKVCRSLFRSVVNFLAHKRIFCTLSHNSDNKFYHEGESSRLTPHSSTLVTSTASASGASPRVSTRKCHQASASSAGSSATNTGSSAYFGRLEHVERNRAAASEDCKVFLEGAGEDVSNAVYQTFHHPDAPSEQPTLRDARLIVREHERGMMAVLGKDGRIISTVGLDSQNLADIPCADDSNALSSGAANLAIKEEPVDLDEDEKQEEEQAPAAVATEQLHKATFHHKTKPQIEHLHPTVNNSCKGKDARSKVSWSRGGEDAEEASPGFADVAVKTESNDEVSAGPIPRSKDEGRASRQSSLLRCPDCSMFFISQRSLEAHKNFYCHSSVTAPSLTSRRASIEAVQGRPLPLPTPSDSPAKKIGIQIRKVYKTEDESLRFPTPVKPKVKSASGRSLSLSDRYNGGDSQIVKSDDTFDYPNSEGPFAASFLLKKVASFCSFKKLRCCLCRRTFSNGSGLRKHAAIHLSWTRFMCLLCGYRDYQECRLVKHLSERHGVETEYASGSYDEKHFINEPFKTLVVTSSNGDPGTPGLSLKTNKRPLESIACIENVPPKKLCTEEPRVAHLKLMDDSPSGKQILTLKLKRVQLDVAPKNNFPPPAVGSGTKSLESIINSISCNPKSARTETNASDKIDSNSEVSSGSIHCSQNKSSKPGKNLMVTIQKLVSNSEYSKTDSVEDGGGTADLREESSQRPCDAVENTALSRVARRRKASPKKFTACASRSTDDSPKTSPSSTLPRTRKDVSVVPCQRKSPDKKSDKAVANSKLVVSVASLTKKSPSSLFTSDLRQHNSKD